MACSNGFGTACAMIIAIDPFVELSTSDFDVEVEILQHV